MTAFNPFNRNTLYALVLCALASPALANSYCENRPTQQDYDNCYRVNIEAQKKLLEKNYRAVINHPDLAAADRTNLEQNQDEWTDSVNSQCRDSACMLNALEARNMQLLQFAQKLKGPAAPAPAASQAAKSPRLTLDQLKLAIRKDRKYEVTFGQVPNESRTRLDYAGLITYQGQQYVIPSGRIVDIIPTYIHKGEVSEYGTITIPGGYCNNTFCKDSNNETLGVLPSVWTELKRQNLIPSDVVPGNATAPVTISSQPAISSAAKLYCSNTSETCTLTINGQELELTREELPKHTDFYQGDRSDCIAEACWGNKGEFLGLNPDYYTQ